MKLTLTPFHSAKASAFCMVCRGRRLPRRRRDGRSIFDATEGGVIWRHAAERRRAWSSTAHARLQLRCGSHFPIAFMECPCKARCAACAGRSVNVSHGKNRPVEIKSRMLTVTADTGLPAQGFPHGVAEGVSCEAGWVPARGGCVPEARRSVLVRHKSGPEEADFAASPVPGPQNRDGSTAEVGCGKGTVSYWIR